MRQCQVSFHNFVRKYHLASHAGADQDQRQAQSVPKSHRAPMQNEAKPAAERQTDGPIPDQIPLHGGSGVAGSAQRAGSDSLEAVEELEKGGDLEQHDREGNDARVMGVDPGDGFRKQQEREGGTDLERSRDARARANRRGRRWGGPARRGRGRRRRRPRRRCRAEPYR